MLQRNNPPSPVDKGWRSPPEHRRDDPNQNFLSPDLKIFATTASAFWHTSQKKVVCMTNRPFDQGFWNGVLKQIVRRTRGHADAEDLLQTAFLRLERYRVANVVENPTAFLVRTAVNIRVDNYRREQLEGSCNPANSLTGENSEPLQDEVVSARARLKRVQAGLAQLTPRTREVFLMHRLDGLEYREIANRLGISQSSVEKHIAKAALFLTEWTEGW